VVLHCSVALLTIAFRCFPLLGYVILFIDIRQGTVDTGSPPSKASTCTCVLNVIWGRLRLKCDDTRAETWFRLSAKRTSPFTSAGGRSVQSTTCSRGVCISGSNAGYTKLRGSVKGTGHQLHSPVSPSLPLPCVTVCHYVSTGLYVNDCNHLTSIGPCIVIIF